MSSSSIDQSASHGGAPGASGIGIAAVLAIVVVACCLHVLASRSGMPVDSLWFTVAGVGFIAVTAAAHLPLTRGDAATSGAVGSLLVSMAIRLSGTFVILGLLLWISPLERGEAVFNVLFWYITLTATDLVSLVRQRRQMENEPVARGPLTLGGSEPE